MRTLSLKQQVINEYYASGQIMSIAEYVGNKKNGLERYYDNDGLIIYERLYKNDAIHGTERWFDENGNVIKEYQYKDSVRQLSKG